ncbi:pyruvate kinase, partial [Kipferlia bialata]
IVATIGPASSPADKLRELYEAGVDTFRLNFSHGTHAEHKVVYDNIRALEEEIGGDTHIGIVADMQGPKLRIGCFENKAKVQLEDGQTFTLHLDDRPGDNTHVQLNHPEIYEAVEPGDMLLCNDGYVRVKVVSCTSDTIVTEVVLGGELSDHK